MARFVDELQRFRVHAADVSFTDEGWVEVEILTSGGAALNGPLPDAESLTLQALWLERDAASGIGGRVYVDAQKATRLGELIAELRVLDRARIGDDPGVLG